jgi:hypothetical protein
MDSSGFHTRPSSSANFLRGKNVSFIQEIIRGAVMCEIHTPTEGTCVGNHAAEGDILGNTNFRIVSNILHTAHSKL